MFYNLVKTAVRKNQNYINRLINRKFMIMTLGGLEWTFIYRHRFIIVDFVRWNACQEHKKIIFQGQTTRSHRKEVGEEDWIKVQRID